MDVQDVKSREREWSGGELSDDQRNRIAEVGTVLESLVNPESEEFSFMFNSSVLNALSACSTAIVVDEYNRALRNLAKAKSELVGAVLWDASESGVSLSDVAESHDVLNVLVEDSVLGNLSARNWQNVN